MILKFAQKQKKAKLTKAEKERKKRLRRSIKPSTQSSIYYQSLFENGLMHVAKNIWSRSYRLGDVAYTSASDEDKVAVIDTYAEATNSLDVGNTMQLLVINRRVESSAISKILYEPADDDYNDLREEYNTMIKNRFSADSRNFKVEKYITLATQAYDALQADTNLHELSGSITDQFTEMDIEFDPLDGLERMGIFSWFLKHSPYLPYTYRDIDLSGLRTKDFVAPNRFHFMENQIKIDDKFAKVMYVRQFPTFLSDKLIKELTSIGIELAITVTADPYNPGEFTQSLQNAQSEVKREMINNQKDGAMQGIDPELAVSGIAQEVNEATKRWQDEIRENDQKAFAGVIAVYLVADSQEELNTHRTKVVTAGNKLGVDFVECYYHQEQALNTMLPIGQIFLDAKKKFVRPMTTTNIATQVPFTNVDLRSDSPRAIYYGQNQLSHNTITLDRKRDLNAGNGGVVGSSGSGKGMSTKTTEIIPTLLRYPDDRVIIVDPEGEYTKIAEAFDGQVLNISPKSKTHLNLLDLPQTITALFNDDDEEIDVIADKANLLMGLFESILKEVDDDHVTIIDRVTTLTYERFETPTLVDWHQVLKEQPEEAAQDLATKAEIYTIGSLNLFSYPTNVDMSSRLIVINLKGLANKLKPFALRVIQDYIWQQVINYQGKTTIRLYWDEVHQSFRTASDAAFFADLWARIRKYGAVPTFITQQIGTLIKFEEGRNLLSNSEFLLLLKHKPQDLKDLQRVVTIPPSLIKYIEKPRQKGSGLLVAAHTIIPFENPIPKGTRLYELAQTDPD
ncbi:VirB4-like conjugal transfer ATPase, CD1110 family [Streptococcus ovuberis]|uniref:DUF87 domain-containing protein n=1 Tax=Streptococcus ovuberis TaxID=1936207 RepID=A0A7X6S112_9STRE|nr:DUF87 domain-containing protein [Streptococcus ovuberis]NKZ19696.1 DUF87 domain-containing protein [Streptococcus ovuberis]